MKRIIVEKKDGDTWKQVKVEIRLSARQNYWFKHDGLVYVTPDLKDGSVILVKTSAGWVKAGRMTHGTAFLGLGESYTEMIQRVMAGQTVWERPILI